MTDNTVPTITVGGRAWPVPPLAFRQLKVIIPALGKLPTGMFTLAELTEERFESLGKIVYTAMTRDKADLTRAAFEEMVLSPSELMLALPVIIRQTGLGAREGDTSPLAQAPAAASPSSTGTASS